MKRVIFLLAAAVAATAVSAQNASRFSCSVALGTGFVPGESASVPFVVRISGYYRVSPRFSAGAGTGLSFYEKSLIPFYADVRLLLARPRRFTPYAGCSAGYAFAVQREANGGLLLSPAFGVQYALCAKGRLFLEAGYEMQRLERLCGYAGPHFTAQFAEKLRHGTILLKIGFLF